jgi:RNA polymerase-associated protein CTR9
MATPPPEPGRSIDIEIGDQEIITLELNDLEKDPTDLLGLLKDGRCTVWVWTKLAAEYWRRGWLDGAQQLALGAIERMV